MVGARPRIFTVFLPESDTRRIHVKLGPVAAVLALAALSVVPARADGPSAPAGPFPCPDSLREGVDFWKKVWGTWTLSQVVLHDTDHPSIVYDVFELPPPVGEIYSDAQRDFVKQRREALAARLDAIELRVAAGQPLTDDEKSLVLAITQAAGTDALAGSGTRVRSQRGLRERFRRGLEISGRYRALFAAIFRSAGLPEDLADLPHVESSFQARARSSAGAVGVWQFTRGAARRFMLVSPGLDERLDPVAAARGAAAYLKAAYDELGTWPLAITSYNHGIEGMRAAKERFGTDFERILAEYDGRAFGFASKNFYKEFLAAREIAAHPDATFPEGLQPDPPMNHDRVVLDRSATPAAIGEKYRVAASTLTEINPGWTQRALTGRAPIPAGATVWLPEGTLVAIAQTATPQRRAEPLPPARKQGVSAAVAAERFIVHVVRKGETLFRIAASYGVSVVNLLDANDLHVNATIHPGQQLRVPTVR